jgi:hypothetical protein
MKRALLIVGGLVLIGLGIVGIVMFWWQDLYVLIKGGFALLVVLTGLIAVLAGILGD